MVYKILWHESNSCCDLLITLLDDNPLHLSVDGTFAEPGVTVLDNVDGTTTTTTASTTPADTAAPVVTLTGAAALELTVGDTFTDAGATATDDVDGDLTVNIAVTGSVDTATAGSYTLTYSATDAAGNVGTASRLVTVVAAAPAPAPAPADTTAPSTPAI